MRILIISPRLNIAGGVETYLRAVISELVAAGHEIGILCDDSLTACSDSIVSAHPEVPIWREDSQPATEIFRELNRWNPNVIYAHGACSVNLENLLLNKYPVVLYSHNYYGTCISGTKCHSRANWNTCERTLGPGCLAAYFPLGCGGNNPFTMLQLYRQQMQRRNSLVRFEKILVASSHMIEEYQRHGLAPDRLALVPLFPPQSVSLPGPPEPRPFSNRLFFAGRLTLLKGLEQLILALPTASQRLNRRLKLVVAGTGPERDRLELLAKQYQLPVTFLGWVTSERAQAEMLQADLLAVPSVWPEPFGLVGIEAGCIGLPSVGFLSGGIRDWLIPGVSGEGTSVLDSEGLADCLVRALCSLDHWQRLRCGAWEIARRFTMERHLEQLLTILHSSIQK